MVYCQGAWAVLVSFYPPSRSCRVLNLHRRHARSSPSAPKYIVLRQSVAVHAPPIRVPLRAGGGLCGPPEILRTLFVNSRIILSNGNPCAASLPDGDGSKRGGVKRGACSSDRCGALLFSARNFVVLDGYLCCVCMCE